MSNHLFVQFGFTQFCFKAGRCVLASLFVLGGINKILNYAPTADAMTQAGLPLVDVLLPVTIVFELCCGLAVMIGRRFAVVSALLLAGFTLITNAVFHRFWTMPGDIAVMELSLFFKNVSIAGGLVFVAASLILLKERG